MKINFDVPLADEEDKAWKEEGKPVLASTAIKSALLGEYAEEQKKDETGKVVINLSTEDREKRYKLYKRVKSGGPQEYTAQEKTLIKTLLGYRYKTTFVVGQVCDIIEGLEPITIQPDDAPEAPESKDATQDNSDITPPKE